MGASENQGDSPGFKRPLPTAWPYYASFILFPMVVLDYHWSISYFTLFFVFGLIPILDVVVGTDDFNPSLEETRVLEKKASFRVVTFMWVPCHFALLLWACQLVSQANASADASGEAMSKYAYVGLILGVGIVGGLGINCAHELIHKSNWYERALGQLLLMITLYPHFYVEHLWGHHKRVATLEDAASARFGESFYAFWPRTVTGSLASAVRLKPGLTLGLWGATVLLMLLVTSVFPASMEFYVWQGVVAFTLLELVNYIEHYGLSRDPSEQVTPFHSWNAGERVTNMFLLKLQRHSDHHAFAGRRYQSLRSWKNSPQLPTGYAGMVLASLFPPVYFYVMNPRVVAETARIAELKKKGGNPFADQCMSVNN
eukprot:ANDGO_00616.mRNA.1 Alkane 1-monooxygenase 2